MKRDMHLIREIALIIEDDCSQILQTPEIHVAGFTEVQIAYHVRIMVDAGLVDAIDANSMDGECWLINGLTWKGHEFLDNARDKSRFDNVLKKVGQVSFSVLTEALKQAAMGMLFGGDQS
ncbi:MAG: DUF2513 domain-containing protein [Planctomycetaceae bacterium]